MSEENMENNLESIFDDDKWTDFCQLYMEEMCKKRGRLQINVDKLMQSRPSNHSMEKFGLINEIFEETIDDNSLAEELDYFIQCLKHFGCLATTDQTKSKQPASLRSFETDYNAAFDQTRGKTKGCTIVFERPKARARAQLSLRSLIFVCYELNKLGFGDVDFYNIPTEMMEKAEASDPTRRGAYDSDKFNKIMEIVKAALNSDKEGVFDATMDENDVEYDESSRDLAERRGSSYTPNGLILQCAKLFNRYNLDDKKSMRSTFDTWMMDTIESRFGIKDSEKNRQKLTEIKRITFGIQVRELRDTKEEKIKGYEMSMRFFVPNFYTFSHLFEKYSLKQLCFMPPIEELYDLLGLFESADLSIDAKEQRIKIDNARILFNSSKTSSELANNPTVVEMVDLLLSLKELMLQTKIIEQEIEPSGWSDYLNIKLTGSSALDELSSDEDTQPSSKPELEKGKSTETSSPSSVDSTGIMASLADFHE